MATSLAVPVAYITVLITALAIFSRVYRRRRLAEKTSFEPWFPNHPSRDIYITLLQSTPPVPDSLLKSALLVRATADVKRIWRLRDDKTALTTLHAKGSVGDDTMSRFAHAEKELEAEIVDVVSEANTFRMGWGQMIFATASEMAMAEKTREIVMGIPKVKNAEEKRLALKTKYLPSQPAMQPPSSTTTTASTLNPKHINEASPAKSTPAISGLTSSSGPGSATNTGGGVGGGSGTSTPPSGSSTPSKGTPNKKKGKKK